MKKDIEEKFNEIERLKGLLIIEIEKEINKIVAKSGGKLHFTFGPKVTGCHKRFSVKEMFILDNSLRCKLWNDEVIWFRHLELIEAKHVYDTINYQLLKIKSI